MPKENELRKLLEIAIPSTIAWIGHIGYSITDNIMAGKILGTAALATSGIATSIYFMFLTFGAGSTGILTALVAEKIAIKEKDEATFVFQNALIFCAILGTLISLLLFFLSGYIVDVVNRQEAIEMEIKRFLKTVSLCPFFITIFFAFERLTEGINRTKISMYTVFICNILNIIFNYIFLKHFEMGVVGVATSTLFVTMFELSIIIFFVKKDKIAGEMVKFKLKYNSLKQIIYTAKLGLPGGVFGFIEAFCFGAAGLIAGLISIYDVAAHQLILWSINFALTPIFGFAVAITARIAFNVAIGKKALAFKIGIIGIIATSIYMLLCMVLFFIFKYEFLGLMLKTDKEDLVTISLVASTLFMVIFVEIFDGVQLMTASVLRGYKDTQLPVLFSLVSYFVFCLPLAYYLGLIKGMGVYGIWVGLGIGLFLQAFALIVRFILKFKPA